MDNLQNDYSIIFSHVQKAYGSNVVINDLNLEIQKGARLILLGLPAAARQQPCV